MYKIFKVIITPIIWIICLISLYLLIMFYYLKLSYLSILISLYLLNLFTIIIVFFSKRREEVRLSWIFAMTVFPIIGNVAFFLYGREYKYKKRNKKYKIYNDTKIVYEDKSITEKNLKLIKEFTPNFYEIFKFSYDFTKRGIYNNSQMKILEPEESWINIINDISKAKKYIYLNYFIFGKGLSSDILCDLLIKKHNEGVLIYFLYDHVGTYFQNIEYKINKLKKSGIKINKFEKFFIPFVKESVIYRNHRKDIIIDGKIGYSGGVNIGDAYLNLDSKLGKINDLHCRITGSSIRSLELIFMNDWYFTTSEEINHLKNTRIIDEKLEDINSDNLNLMHIIDSGPIKPLSIHMNTILKMISNAKKRIWLSTPYFIPPEVLLNELKIAGKLGKDVRILIPGKTDKAFILSLSKLYALDLIKYNIKIYIMNNVFNHAKFFLFDDSISIISTTNLDNRSFFLDYQTMVINYSKSLNKKFTYKFEEYFQLSYLLTYDEIKNWSLIYKVFIKGLKIVSPIL